MGGILTNHGAVPLMNAGIDHLETLDISRDLLTTDAGTEPLRQLYNVCWERQQGDPLEYSW
ncbi:MAG TPA: hypothetical protein DCG12_02405 [Planctomycetaceae bacterium]|nr:hypothetical protein [Planctomycetaceae bacterium]